MCIPIHYAEIPWASVAGSQGLSLASWVWTTSSPVLSLLAEESGPAPLPVLPIPTCCNRGRVTIDPIGDTYQSTSLSAHHVQHLRTVPKYKGTLGTCTTLECFRFTELQVWNLFPVYIFHHCRFLCGGVAFGGLGGIWWCSTCKRESKQNSRAKTFNIWQEGNAHLLRFCLVCLLIMTTVWHWHSNFQVGRDHPKT